MSVQPDRDGLSQQRSEARVGVVLDVGVRRPGAHCATIALRDISTRGFRAEIFERVFPGDRLWLKLPGLEGWQSQVSWVRGDEVGCQFVQPLHPAVLNIIVMKAGANRRG